MEVPISFRTTLLKLMLIYAYNLDIPIHTYHIILIVIYKAATQISHMRELKLNMCSIYCSGFTRFLPIIPTNTHEWLLNSYLRSLETAIQRIPVSLLCIIS